MFSSNHNFGNTLLSKKTNKQTNKQYAKQKIIINFDINIYNFFSDVMNNQQTNRFNKILVQIKSRLMYIIFIYPKWNFNYNFNNKRIFATQKEKLAGAWKYSCFQYSSR